MDLKSNTAQRPAAPKVFSADEKAAQTLIDAVKEQAKPIMKHVVNAVSQMTGNGQGAQVEMTNMGKNPAPSPITDAAPRSGPEVSNTRAPTALVSQAPVPKKAPIAPRPPSGIRSAPAAPARTSTFTAIQAFTGTDTAIQALTGIFGCILLLNGIFSFHIADGKLTDLMTLIEILTGSIFLISSVLPLHPATKFTLLMASLLYFTVSCMTLYNSSAEKLDDKTRGAEILVGILGICISLFLSIFIIASYLDHTPNTKYIVGAVAIILPFTLGLILAFVYKIL